MFAVTSRSRALGTSWNVKLHNWSDQHAMMDGSDHSRRVQRKHGILHRRGKGRPWPPMAGRVCPCFPESGHPASPPRDNQSPTCQPVALGSPRDGRRCDVHLFRTGSYRCCTVQRVMPTTGDLYCVTSQSHPSTSYANVRRLRPWLPPTFNLSSFLCHGLHGRSCVSEYALGKMQSEQTSPLLSSVHGDDGGFAASSLDGVVASELIESLPVTRSSENDLGRQITIVSDDNIPLSCS